MSDSGCMEVIINHHYTEDWQGYRPRNFLPDNLASLPISESSVNNGLASYQQIYPSCSRHGFRPEHSTTTALLQLTAHIAMGLNQSKHPDLIVCVAVYLSGAFDTVFHHNLLSKTNRFSSLGPGRDGSPVIYEEDKPRLVSEYRTVNTGVPQDSKMSRPPFSFYIADMPRTTDPFKRV